MNRMPTTEGYWPADAGMVAARDRKNCSLYTVLMPATAVSCPQVLFPIAFGIL